MVWDFIMLLKIACNLKFINWLFLSCGFCTMYWCLSSYRIDWTFLKVRDAIIISWYSRPFSQYQLHDKNSIDMLNNGWMVSIVETYNFICPRMTSENCLCSHLYMATVIVTLLNQSLNQSVNQSINLNPRPQRADSEMGLPTLLCPSPSFPEHLEYRTKRKGHMQSWKLNHTLDSSSGDQFMTFFC